MQGSNGGALTEVQLLRAQVEVLQTENSTLRLASQMYRELVQGANSIILRLDTIGRVTFFNEYAQRFFGYTEQEILGKNVVGTIVPESESTGRDLRKLLADLAINPEKYMVNENENQRRNGERVWLAWTNSAIRDTRGNIAGALCVGNDITAYKRREAWFRSLFSNMPEGAAIHRLVYDAQGKAVNYEMLDVNPAYETILNLKHDAVVGRLATEVYGTPEAPYLTEYAGVASSGKALRFETFFAPMSKHFTISVAPLERDGFATIFLTINRPVQVS